MGERLIELKNIAKTYGRVFAVGGVNFHVDRGEVVGLLGDNGAGKSTLIKMLAGAIEPTSGEILVRGKRETHWNAARSRNAGIETVFQDRALCVQQTITRNIFLGREATNAVRLSRRQTRTRRGRAADARDRFHLESVHAGLDRRAALGRRAAGRRARARHLQ